MAARRWFSICSRSASASQRCLAMRSRRSASRCSASRMSSAWRRTSSVSRDSSTKTATFDFKTSGTIGLKRKSTAPT
jgi:hypothetical protein